MLFEFYFLIRLLEIVNFPIHLFRSTNQPIFELILELPDHIFSSTDEFFPSVVAFFQIQKDQILHDPSGFEDSKPIPLTERINSEALFPSQLIGYHNEKLPKSL